jgi:hypothetical protein
LNYSFYLKNMNEVCTIVSEREWNEESLVQGVLGNKCAGQHNLETIYFEETIVSGYFLAGVGKSRPST